MRPVYERMVVDAPAGARKEVAMESQEAFGARVRYLEGKVASYEAKVNIAGDAREWDFWADKLDEAQAKLDELHQGGKA